MTSDLTVDTKIGFTEFVEIRASFEHSSFRDLSIELVSPSGAVSKLVEEFDTLYNSGVVRLNGQIRMGSARHLGEDPNGVWQLRVTDRVPSSYGGVNLDGVLVSWGITVYGHERIMATDPFGAEALRSQATIMVTDVNEAPSVTGAASIDHPESNDTTVRSIFALDADRAVYTGHRR